QLGRLLFECLFDARSYPSQRTQTVFRSEVPSRLEAVGPPDQLQYQLAFRLVDFDLALEDQVADPVAAIRAGIVPGIRGPSIELGVPGPGLGAVVAHEVGDQCRLAVVAAEKMAIAQPVFSLVSGPGAVA